MKRLLSTILISMVSSLAFATDWTEYIKEYPSLRETKLRLDNDGHVEAKVFKRASGKYRFLGFNSYSVSKRPIITIDSANITDTNELCQNSLRLNKKFKATMRLQVDPLFETSNNENSLIKGIALKDFENPVNVSETVLEFSKAGVGWSFWDTENTLKANGNPVWTVYLDFLNKAIKESSSSGSVEVDLSEYNGLACDLLDGTLVIRLKKEVSYEAGKPVGQTWLGSDQFTNIYKSFWKTHPLLTFTELTSKENAMAEAALLGYVSAQEIQSSELFKNNQRIQTLLQSMKLRSEKLKTLQPQDTSSKELIDNLMMTYEYSVPSKLQIQSSYIIFDGAVTTKFGKMEKL